MNLSDEIRKQIEKNKGLKLAVGEINNHLSTLENLVRKDIMEQVDEAYQKGLEDGKKAFDLLESERNSEYQRGLSEGNDIGYKDGVKDGQNEAWEAAKKVVLNPDEGGLDIQELDKIFNCATIQQVFRRHTLSEAIAKLKAYEEKPSDKIEVGDEVTHKSDSITWTAVVTQNVDGMLTLMEKTGAIAEGYDEKYFVKTGRHFDIASILEAMKHD